MRTALSTRVRVGLAAAAGVALAAAGLSAAHAATTPFNYTLTTSSPTITDRPTSGCEETESGTYYYQLFTMTVDTSGYYNFEEFDNAQGGSPGYVAFYAPGTTAATIEADPTAGCLEDANSDDGTDFVSGQTYVILASTNDPLVTGPVTWEVSSDDGTATLTPLGARVSPEVCEDVSKAPEGYNLIVGTAGADNLTGTSGQDVIYGLAGADKITGLGGDDILCGGSGANNIEGSGGGDLIVGGSGGDKLSGSAGDDRLFGGTGTDNLIGGAGYDVGVDADRTTSRTSIESTVDSRPLR